MRLIHGRPPGEWPQRALCDSVRRCARAWHCRIKRATVRPSARGDRPRRVGAPLAPRARVQRRAARPACSIASRLWQAVTPEPHWCTHGGRRVASSGAKSARSCRGGLKRPSALQVVLEEAVARAGDVAGHRVERLDLAAETFGRRGHRARCTRPSGPATRSASMVGIARRAQRVGRLRRRWPARRCSSAPPAACQAAQAAVEHRDRVVAQPAQQPPGPRGIGAALRRRSTTTGVAGRDAPARRPWPRRPRALGSGWRPLRAASWPPDRSRSRSAWCAPGRWPCA